MGLLPPLKEWALVMMQENFPPPENLCIFVVQNHYTIIMVPISVRVPSELAERLNFLSQKTGRAKNFYIREALEDHIEDLEDFFLGVEALRSSEEVYSFEEAKKILLEGGSLED